jgi:hypothetical protein
MPLRLDTKKLELKDLWARGLVPDDEELKAEGDRLLKEAQLEDEGVPYREAMEKKAEQSRMAQLQAPPKRGKKPPVSEEAVEEAVEKRKAPFMYRSDYQIGEKPLGTMTAEEKLEFPNRYKFPERLKREQELGKEYESLLARRYSEGEWQKLREGYKDDAFKVYNKFGEADENLGMIMLRNNWAVNQRTLRRLMMEEDPDYASILRMDKKDYLDFAEAEVNFWREK